MSRYFTAAISENTPVGWHHRRLGLIFPEGVRQPKPGQFYMVRVRESSDPLLKRPFSLFRKTSSGIELLYRVQGRGTGILAGMTAGEKLEILGPLGRGYPSHDFGPDRNILPVVISGGIGVASVFSLVEALEKKAIVIYGARSAGDLLMVDQLKELSKELLICTDDGTEGLKGNVGDILLDIFSKHRSGAMTVYACGPKPMLKAVSILAGKSGVKAYLSLEEHMACGIGACLGCVVKIKGQGSGVKAQGSEPITEESYQRVCMEGPVFNASDVVW